MTACRSAECGKPILWAHTGEKYMPVDVERVDDGNVRLSRGEDPPRATVLSGQELVQARVAGEPLHKSHFATCPAAAKHRKEKAA